MPTQFCTYTGHLPPDEGAAAAVAFSSLLKNNKFQQLSHCIKSLS